MLEKENEDEVIIDLYKFKKIWIEKWYFLILFGLMIGAIVYLISSYRFEPSYSSSVYFYVDTTSQMKEAEESSNFDVASLISTYCVFLKNNTEFSQKIQEMSQTGYTVRQISSLMKCESINSNAPVFRIIFSCPSSVEAYNLAFSAQLLAEEVLQGTFSQGKLQVIREAELSNTSTTSDDSIRYGLLGGVLGAIVLYLLLVFVELFRKKIRTEDDLICDPEIPLLGVLPSFPKVSGKEYGYKSSGR
jgi:capsular polysaccharide biosynthesis protein